MNRISIVVCVSLILAVVYFLAYFWAASSRSWVRTAIYERIVMFVGDGRAFKLQTPLHADVPESLGALFVRVTGGRVVALNELTVTDAAQLTGEAGDSDGHGGTYFRHGMSILKFENNQLSVAIFCEGSDIELATSPDGPFFTLPITKQRMIEIFGKPLRWGESVNMGP